jgi:hypothetical protein
MSLTFEATRQGYLNLWGRMQVRPQVVAAADAIVMTSYGPTIFTVGTLCRPLGSHCGSRARNGLVPIR